MTGSRELTVLQALRALRGSGPDELSSNALAHIAVSLAALADLYELEVSCLSAPGGDDADDAEDASEAHPS